MYREEKEREISKMRQLQESQAHQHGEIDTRRAQRAFEQSEKEAAERERLQAQKRTRLLQDLDDARKKQFEEKEQRLTLNTKQERDEFLGMI